MWEGERVHVLQVWSQVPAQAELCLPPEEEAQDCLRDGGGVCQLRTGRLHWERPGSAGLISLSSLSWTLFILSQGGLRDPASFS